MIELLLETPEEKQLFYKLKEVYIDVAFSESYDDRLKSIESLSPYLNTFLDNTYMNCENKKLKDARFTLLVLAKTVINSVVDLTDLYLIKKETR